MSTKAWIIIGAIVLTTQIITGSLVGTYNQFVGLGEQTDSSWVQVETVSRDVMT